MKGAVNLKITSFGVNSVNPYNNQQRNIKSSVGKTSFSDKIEISTAAKEMQVSSNYSTERAERVQNLKEKIQSGEYKVDARKVAEDMLKYYRY